MGPVKITHYSFQPTVDVGIFFPGLTLLAVAGYDCFHGCAAYVAAP